MKSQFVGFLKQDKNRVSDGPFDATPSRANFLTTIAFSKSVRLIPTENKRMQLCFQTELAEENSQSLHS